MGALFHFLFSFEGRIGRQSWRFSQYALFALAIGWAILASEPSIIAGNKVPQYPTGTTVGWGDHNFWPGFLVLAWFYCWIWIATTAKRLHDLDQSGWRALPAFGPTLVFGIVFIVTDRFSNTERFVMLSPIMFACYVVQWVAGRSLLALCSGKDGEPVQNRFGHPTGSFKNNIDDFYNSEDFLIHAAQKIETQTTTFTQTTKTATLGTAKPVFGRRQ